MAQQAQALSNAQIFNAAADLSDEAERAAYLDRACAGNAALRAEIEELLRHDAAPDGILASRACAPAPAGPPLETAGTVIGPYRLLEQIGEGGFGVVFMAEQLAPVRRKVALKVLKPGMDTLQVIARFEAERQALALMDHPNIATVLDAGATTAGRPYFVMELVRGLPITEYCDAHHLTPRERLDLFVTVCHSVQHAHQKGIIHRDLKPSNVLVTLHDGRPVPKVIDFGIAKATGEPLTERTLFTAFAQVIGTPLYMSPEQASMNALDVDTRSDVYSLGVLLYELLTGATPFDRARLKEAAFDEVRRIIREEEPATPSARLSRSNALPTLAANRGTEPARLARLVRGDLDWIVMKALEKDRSLRYETANGLAADVKRYLADEPVSACPPSLGYRLRKFARRNKAPLAAATFVGAMLLVAAGGFGWTARDRAARRGRDAEAVAALLDRCDDALRGDAADRAAVALEAAGRRAIEGGAKELEGRLFRARADIALLRALDAVDAFRWTWVGDSHPPSAAVADRLRAALGDYGIVPDEDAPGEAAERVKASLLRDRVLAALDRWLDAAPSAAVRSVLAAADPDPYRDAVRDAVARHDAPALIRLSEQPESLVQPARFAAVLGMVRVVPVERRRVILENALDDRPGDLALLMGLAGSWMDLDGRDELRRGDTRVERERLRWCQAAVSAHPGNVAANNNLGTVLWAGGDLERAIVCFNRAIGIDPTFARGYYNLGVVFAELKKPDEAVAYYREAIRHKPPFGTAHYELGRILRGRGEIDQTISLFREAVRIEPLALYWYELGLLLEERGDLTDAIAACRAAIDLKPDFAEAHCNLGGYLGRVGAFADALKHLRTGHELGRQREDWRHRSDQWVREAERRVALDARLQPVLAGEAADPSEILALADVCLRFKRRNVDAARLYARAFAAPGLAQPSEGCRFNAACAAALAAGGHGDGAAELTPSDKVHLRGLAFDWLRAELATRGEPGGAEAVEQVLEELQHWLSDPDLRSVREENELAALPEPERQRWTKLWNDVRDLRARVAKK